MRIRHGRLLLAMHRRASGGAREAAPTLLLLHALGGSSADWGDAVEAWPGPVHALDFSGHGESDWLPGGGYTPEGFAADADCALAALEASGAGEVRLAGRGLGAYVALLVAGARPRTVGAALLLPGRGLEGGGALPDFERLRHPPPVREPGSYDSLAGPCEEDARPPDYASEFARAARHLWVAESLWSSPPPWLEAALESGRTSRIPDDARRAIATLARAR